jgi:hypothetical protein
MREPPYINCGAQMPEAEVGVDAVCMQDICRLSRCPNNNATTSQSPFPKPKKLNPNDNTTA